MKSHKNRGRPKANKSFIDKGTEALQRKRRALVEGDDAGALPLSASLLGVFYSRGLIPKNLYQTGCHFADIAYDYESCFGHFFRDRRSSLVFERKGRGEGNIRDKRDKKKIKMGRKAFEALKSAGEGPYRTVMHVVFYEHDLYTEGVPRALEKKSADLKRGLEQLEKCFGATGREGKKYSSLSSNENLCARFGSELTSNG